ncbi:MAG TPA: AsmA family protein [Methyloceanibacter sp.]|nr:AsmA family protein [Methyloceanibacter sp.]
MKKLLIGIAVVIVLVIVAAIAIPFFIPVDTYKGQLIAQVKQATGRDLRIDGKMSFSLIPNIALEANDVSFSNPPGAAAKDMAKLGKLQVQLKFWPLLHKDIEVDRLVLVDPTIDLEVDKQGKPNWQFASSAAPAQPPAAPAGATAPSSGGTGGSLAQLRLDDVRLVNGHVTYVDQRTGDKKELTEIGMKLSLPGLDQPFSADGSAVWNKEKVSLNASFANLRAFMDGKSSGAALKVAAKPVSFDFKGNASGGVPLKLDGTVDLQVPSVRQLAAWAGSPLTAPGTGFGPLAISGKVAYAGPKITFSDANLSLDNIKAKGEIAVDTAGARPAIKGQLAVDKLDVNPYLPPENAANAPAAPSGGGGGATGANAKSDWSDDPIDVSGLKAGDLEFQLSANAIQYRKIQVGKSALHLDLKGGRFEADLTELALYQGAGKGKVVLDGSGAVPAIDTSFNLNNVQMQPLLKDAAGTDRLGGAGAFDMAVTGKGKSQREIVSSLNGKGDLNLANGVIKGVNLVGMVKNIASALQGGDAQETDFASLTATYTITNGVLRNNDLALKSAEVPMTGAGTVDLPHRTVDYKITPKLAGALAVPIIVKGPWDHLSYQPDLAGMVGDPSKLIQGGAKGVGDALKQQQPGVDNLLKGFLGGKKQQ